MPRPSLVVVEALTPPITVWSSDNFRIPTPILTVVSSSSETRPNSVNPKWLGLTSSKAFRPRTSYSGPFLMEETET